MIPSLLIIALIAYIVGVFLTTIATIYPTELARRAASLVFVAAWVAHLGALVQRGIEAGQVPLANSGEYLLVLGWVVMTLHLVLWFRWRMTAAGFVLPTLAALAGFAALALLRVDAPVHSPGPRGLFLFHTTVSTLGMATLCVALAMSLIYLAQDRALKARKTLQFLERMPSLERCDRIGLRALTIGFILLSVGIATGMIVNQELNERIWIAGVKQTLPLLAWIVFAAILVARFRVGFRGRKSAYLTITGVTLGLLTVVGMTL